MRSTSEDGRLQFSVNLSGIQVNTLIDLHNYCMNSMIAHLLLDDPSALEWPVPLDGEPTVTERPLDGISNMSVGSRTVSIAQHNIDAGLSSRA